MTPTPLVSTVEYRVTHRDGWSGTAFRTLMGTVAWVRPDDGNPPVTLVMLDRLEHIEPMPE